MTTQTYVLGSRSKKRLEKVHPDLVKVITRAIELTPQDFTVLEGLRTPDRQRELVRSGASQTMNSKHLAQADGYSHAVDIAPWGDFDANGTNEVSWTLDHYYAIAEAVRAAAVELGVQVRWGGCWKTLNLTDASAKTLVESYSLARRAVGKNAFIDAPHFELVE